MLYRETHALLDEIAEASIDGSRKEFIEWLMVSRQPYSTVELKTIVLWKLDRLSRNLRDGVNVLADWADRGLKIVVVTQQLELSGVLGRTIAAARHEDAEIGGNDGEQINDAKKTCGVAQRTAHAQQAQQVFNSKQEVNTHSSA